MVLALKLATTEAAEARDCRHIAAGSWRMLEDVHVTLCFSDNASPLLRVLAHPIKLVMAAVYIVQLS